MEAFRQTRRRGAALMLSLWALFLLSAMVISWALDIGARLSMSGNASRNLEARALACSGAEVALHTLTKPGSPALLGSFGRNQTFEARITGEGGRLNLVWLVKGENPQRLEVLRKFLEVKGVDLNERDQMIDTLLDWVDADNLVRLNGAEEEAGYKAANKMITRLEELKKIMGWEEFTSTNDWDADLTLNSTGPIDILWASRDVLLALPDMDEMRVEQFLVMRAGADEIDGTEDDPFKSDQEALVALGIPPAQFAGLIGKDDMLRVISVGTSGQVSRTVRMVFKKGNNLELKSWKEF
jgi:general secretion pathway protein K